MAGQVKEIAEIQSEYRKWEDDHSLWQANIDKWREDQEAFVEELARIRKAIEEYRFVLEIHADAVAESHSRLEDHERIMQQPEEWAGELQESLLEMHRGNESKHYRQQRLHERIRRHHQAVKEALARLKMAAEAL